MTRRRRGIPAAVALAALLAAGSAAGAQGGPGFRFKAPTASLSLRAGFGAPSARSDLFDFVTDTLSLGRGDFGGMQLAADFALLASPGSRWALVLGVGHQSSSAMSDFRNWEDGDGRPIEQRTQFRQVPISLGVRAALTSPGRQIGSLAWVPAQLTPYVTAGGGTTWYRFRQRGDFVDFATFDVFNTTVQTSGWGATAYAGGGFDWTLHPGLAITTDARWQFGSADVGGDFEGFDRIDLSGLAITTGLTFRF